MHLKNALDFHLQFEKRKKQFKSLAENRSRKIRTDDKDRQIFAFDTETIDGYCKLIACSDSSFKFVNSLDEILVFLTKVKYSQSVNFFWNIDYDFFAIIKYLPPELLRLFYQFKFIRYGDYEIKWIPKKAFEIKKNKRTYRFFDLWQFYRMSLNKASQKYLNDSKIEIDIENVEDYFQNAKLRKQLID